MPNERIPKESFTKIDVPADNSCLFWAVTLAYLIPVKNNAALFRQRYEALFGNEETATQNLDHVRNLVQNDDTYDDTFVGLVRNTFRNRVVDHISSHENEFRAFVAGDSGYSFNDYLNDMRNPNTWGGEPEIRAMSEMLDTDISVSGESNTRYANGDVQIQLFHVGASGARNHYNFGLEQHIVNDNEVGRLQNNLKESIKHYRGEPQELIQRLIQEADSLEASTSTQQRKDFESFQARFQSYIDQILSYLHSVKKPGFFPHFFLGIFSTLLDTEVAEKLNIKKIYFSFDTSKTLKVVIVRNGQIGSAEDAINNINLFSISEGKRGHQFTSSELENILRENIDKSKIKDQDVEQNIKDEIQDRMKSRLVQISKGKDGIFVDMEVEEILDSPTSHEFHEIEKGLWDNPEGDIAKLAGSNKQTVEESLKKVLEKISDVHSKYEDSLQYDSSAREAAHHGFIAGALNNFRYRYNLRVYLEQFAGRGYADIVLLVRGPGRALDSISVIMEVKVATAQEIKRLKELKELEKSRKLTENEERERNRIKENIEARSVAALEQQAKNYAQGFQPNVQRVLTTADDILYVVVNFDSPSPISNIEAVSRKGKLSLFFKILKSTDDWDIQEIDKRELKKWIKDNLERIYHTFPGTPEKGDNHYFSRFLLGQSLLLNEVEDLETKFEKHIFIYGEDIPTETHHDSGRRQRPAGQRAKEKMSTGLDKRHAVVSMVLIPESTKKLVYVINIVEANRKDVLNKVLPLDRLSQKIGNREIVELDLNFDTRYKSNFQRYLTVEVSDPVSLEHYNEREVDEFQGTFRKIPYPNELKEAFDRALDSQLTSAQLSSIIEEYEKLSKKIGEGILPFKTLIGKETDFQGVLHGVFSHYSDLKLQESPETRALVLTEFQTGRGERIDMVVHGLKFQGDDGKAKEYVLVGFEFKTSRQGKGAEALLEEAIKQIKEKYREGVTYKTLNDGDEVVFIAFVFNKGARDADSLILVSKELITAKVVHSSTHVLPQMENLRTLEFATAKEDYHYWLQQHDIADIARIEYGYETGGADTLFEIVGSPEHIANQLQQFQNSVTTRDEGRPLTLVVNLDNNHWVTLVIAYQNGQYNGYYVDSLGGNVPDNIGRVLEQAQITVHDVFVTQQTDGHNCGLWALENARDINVVLQENGSRDIPIDEIRNRLQVRERNEDYFIRMRENVSDRLNIDPQRIANLETIPAEIQQPVGQCSKERKKRNVGMACVDSRDEEDITKEEKERRIKELLDTDEIRERTKNIEFYDQLFKISERISRGETIDQNVEEAFITKIKGIDLNSIDPEIKDIVKEMKDSIENKEEIKNVLGRSGVAEKIGKVAEGAGLAFTVFLVGKHIANGNIEGLGYDALNLWVMPKIGEKISGKILELGTKLDSQMLKGFAPVVGRAIGNFAAFLGLAESIKARKNAKDPVDIKIADLNIATNSIFIAADVPAVVTEIMSVGGIETGVVGEFAGPVGAAASVAVIIISQFIEAGFEVEKLAEQINLTDQEKHDLYWGFFFGKRIPDDIERDIEAKVIYGKYISKIMDRFKGKYGAIAMSLPEILITKEEQGIRVESSHMDRVIYTGSRIVKNEFDFNSNVKFLPGITSFEGSYSRVVPSTVENYDIICGPYSNDIAEVVIKSPEYFSSIGGSDGKVFAEKKERWFLQGYPDQCQNAVVYKSRDSSKHRSMYYILSQNANINVHHNDNIDIIFQGSNMFVTSDSNRDIGNEVENRYYFSRLLESCKVHKSGNNFFYVTGEKFTCNLGTEEQKNIVVIQGNFTDSENIHSIIGSNATNFIEVSRAGYVDGKGGNDVITAKNFTTIRGYFGDSIHGNGLVLLPINFSDIDKITHINNITNIYSKSVNFISVDKQTLVKTADGLFVTPTKVDNGTSTVTSLQVTKSMGSDVVLDDELNNLRKIDNSNFNITKQLSSINYHSTIGSSSNHIFYPDKENHNFYWEAPSNVSHLYLFDERNANITIAKANGILDFSQLNSTLNDMPFIENNEGEIKINKNGLNVTLLPDYKDVTVTFDGEEYYKLQDGELERDYCSHSLRVDGRFYINGTDLLNHHNCFTFDSDKVLFLKLKNDLLLLSDRGALSISDYYSSVHKNWDLSIELSDRIMEPEEFEERADDFSSFRYYQPGEQGLQIYHNQPVNKNDIGLVDLKDKSMLDCNIKIIDDDLVLSYKNNTFAKVENWGIYPSAREMIFAFNDTTIFNSKCMVSTCNSEDVMVEFNKEKIILQIFDAIKQNNIDAKDKDGKTLFHIVAKEGDLGSTMLLVDKIESINFERSLYAEPDELVRAVRQRERLKSLINEKDEFGYTPLQYAAKNGKWDIVNLFLDKTAERNPNDVTSKNQFSISWTTVHYAVYNGNLNLIKDTFQFLSDKDAIINTKDSSGWAPLHYAVLYGEFDIVKFLVDEGASISTKDTDNKTPLELTNDHGKLDIANFLTAKQIKYDNKLLTAVRSGNVSEVTDLLNRGADIEVRDRSGKTPLYLAAIEGHLDVVKFLLNRKADIKARDYYDWTPLHLAAINNQLDVVKFLVAKGANIGARSKDGKTPLDIASESGYFETLRLLISKAIEENKLDVVGSFLDKSAKAKGVDVYDPDSWRHDWKIIHYAVYYGNLDIVRDILKFPSEKVGSVNSVSDGWVTIHYAVYYNRKDIISFLIDQGSSIEAETSYGQRTPLHIAVEQGRLDIFALLVSKGANINAMDTRENQTPMEKARASGKSDIVKLLDYVISNNSTPLHYAAREGKLELADLLLGNGANIDAKDKNDWTPLHHAVAKLELATFLINKEANIDAKESYGWTPLHFAAYYDSVRLELAALLVEKGADIEAKTDRGWKYNSRDYKKDSTPLDVANVSGKQELADFLSEKRAQGNSGWSPLHYAARHGKKELATFMVENGANIEAEDKDGKTPLDVARSFGKQEIASFLEQEERRRNEGSTQHHRERSQEEDRSPSIGARNRRSITKEDEHSSQNDEIGYNKATSRASKPSSLINNLFSWVKDSVGGLFSSRTALSRKQENSTVQGLPSISQHNETAKGISPSGFLSVENVALLGCIADALDNAPGKRYQTLVDKGVNFVPSTQTAVTFACREFDSFVEDKIRSLDSKEKARIRDEVKNAYPEIAASLRRGVEFSGNVGLDDVLEKCKKCFCTSILTNNISQSESQMPGKTDDKPQTYLNDPTVDKQLQRSYQTISSGSVK